MTAQLHRQPQLANRTWHEFFPELETAAEVDELLLRTSRRSAEVYALEADRPTTASCAPTVTAEALARAAAEHQSVLTAVAFAIANSYRDALRTATGPALGLVGPDVVANACRQLSAIMADLLARAIVVDLHRLRTAGALAGDDSRARYRAFHARLTSPAGLADFFARFPLLGADLDRHAERFVRALGSTLVHYAAARTEIEERLGVRPDALLTEVRPGAGDSHRGGKSVAVLSHSDGTTVVYKPRSVELDLAFAELLGWCNDRFATRYPVCAFVGRADHAFAQYLPSPIPDTDALLDYYRCAGGLLAILHTLNGTDVHFENLRTADDLPIAIDLETLLHVPMTHSTPAADHSPAAALAAISASVTRIGMLPRTMGMSTSVRSVDLGALGYQPGHRSPRRVFQIRDDLTDQMRVAFDHMTIDRVADVPTIATDDLAAYLITALTEGFESQYRRLAGAGADYRDLVAALFRDRQLRYVNADTQFYVQLLNMCRHPDLSQEPASREVLMHRVALRIRDQPPAVHRSEIDDLLAGDVPYLTVNSSDTQLHRWDGTPLGAHVDVPPLAAALAKIDTLGEDDLARQLRIIAMTMLDKRPDALVRTGIRFGASTGQQSRGGRGGRHDRYVATATRIGQFLLDTMYPADRRDVPSDWIAAVPAQDGDVEGWRASTLGLDLYSGRPGVAVALAALGSLTGRTDFRDAALSVAHPLSALLAAEHPLHARRGPLGLFNGRAGMLDAVHRVGRILDDDSLLDVAYQRLRLLSSAIRDDDQFDIVGGTAGVLALAVRMWRTARTDGDRAHARPVVAAASDHLYRARSHAHITGTEALARSGYAHGAAGFYAWLNAASVVLADRADPDTAAAGRARAAADRFLDHERALFDPERHDWWRDEDRVSMSYGWCHGAPGILVAKLLSARVRPELQDSLAGEAARAAELTRGHGFGNNVTYCHGDLGNLEILAEYADVVDDRKLGAEVGDTFERLHDERLAGMLDATDNRYALADGLLVGLGGTAYALARAVRPDVVEPVLW